MAQLVMGAEYFSYVTGDPLTLSPDLLTALTLHCTRSVRSKLSQLVHDCLMPGLMLCTQVTFFGHCTLLRPSPRITILKLESLKTWKKFVLVIGAMENFVDVLQLATLSMSNGPRQADGMEFRMPKVIRIFERESQLESIHWQRYMKVDVLRLFATVVSLTLILPTCWERNAHCG